MDCVAWLHAVNEKLSDCGDTAGDKDSIQSQLDKLQVGSSSYRKIFCNRIKKEATGNKQKILILKVTINNIENTGAGCN